MKVDQYLDQLNHPLKSVLMQIRQTMLMADPLIAEEIKWNSLAFYYTGSMPEFDPKLYKRHVLVCNTHKDNSLRLVFLNADAVTDTLGLFKGNYADGRKIAEINDFDKSIEQWLSTVCKSWINSLVNL